MSFFPSWASTSSPVDVPVVKGKTFPKVFLSRSENEEDVAALSATPCIMVLSVGDPAAAAAAFSVEMSDSSDISSRSRVPLEVAKSWPCSTGIDSLVNFLFPFCCVPRHALFSSSMGLDGSLLPALPLFSPKLFHSLFEPFCLKLRSLSCSHDRVVH